MSSRVWATSEDGKIEYVSLTSTRLEDAIQLLRTSFFPYENVCNAIGFSRIPEAFVELDDMIINTAKHGVSIVAIDRETGKIAGALINKIQVANDLTTGYAFRFARYAMVFPAVQLFEVQQFSSIIPLPAMISLIIAQQDIFVSMGKNTTSKEYYEDYIKKARYPETKGLFQFLIDTEDGIDPLSLYEADYLMELVFLGVSTDYSKRGIGYMLCQVAVQLATLLYKEENIKTSLDNTELPLDPRPQVVTAVFTTFISQKIGKKLNFDILKTIHCKDLYYNGRSYASILENQTKVFTVECKKLEK